MCVLLDTVLIHDHHLKMKIVNPAEIPPTAYNTPFAFSGMVASITECVENPL
jgi:hypothetical protein